MTLSACLTESEPALVQQPPVTITVSPPDALLNDCPETYKGPFRTIRDLNNALQIAEKSVSICNADKKALRRWKSESVNAIPVQ